MTKAFPMDGEHEMKLEQIREILASGDASRLEGVLDDLKPPDIADIVSAVEEEHRVGLIRSMKDPVASEVLTLLDEGVAHSILSRLEVGEVVPLIDHMASDDATDLINLLPEEQVPAVLRSISRKDYEDVSELLKFDEESAGGLMARELLTVGGGMRISDLIESIRNRFEDMEHYQYIYVVDNSGILLGIIPLVNLLVVDPGKRVDEVMNRDVITVTADTDQEEVAALFARYDLYSLPVVEKNGRLAGRITVDDIIDVIEEEANEDITMMAGTGEEEFYERSPVKLSRARLPWLLTGLLGGIASAVVMQGFKASLESIIALAFFVPVIMAMGGNVGIQSSAIVVREIALGGMSIQRTGSKLLRELKVSIINGIVIGSVLLLTVTLWQKDYRLGLLLGLCMFFIIFWATLMGAIIPLTLRKINVDPALATGPFITTFNDIIGVVFYLGIASLFLDWLGKG